MNSQIQTIESAKMFVDEFKPIYTNSDGKLTRNPFPNPMVGKKDGIHKSLWFKNFSSLYPSELKHIIKYLNKCSEDMLLDATLAYLRYFKTKKKSEYESEYEKLLNHYATENENKIVKPNIDDDMELYLLEISIGSTTFYKIGISTNTSKRISNIRSDISIKYDMVATSVNLIKSWRTTEAEEYETKYISEISTKLKYCFNGSSECFMSSELKEKILHQMNNNYHLEW